MEDVKFKFEDLIMYQQLLDVIDDVYVITKKFPKDKLYGLTSQYKRAAVSISLNIAEGSGDTDAQFNRYLQMAWDSSKECAVCSTIASRQGFITPKDNNDARATLSELAKMITSLQRYLRKSKRFYSFKCVN